MSILKPSAPLIDERQMTHYGISRVPVDYFHFRKFRYTSFADALAQARREAEADVKTPDGVSACAS